MPRHLPSLHPRLTPLRPITTTGARPSPPAPGALPDRPPTLAEVVAPYLPHHGSEDTAPLQIEVIPDGTPEDGARLRERHAAERRSDVEYVDTESHARSVAHVALDLHDVQEIVLGWNEEGVPVLASLGRLVALEGIYLATLDDHYVKFKRRCFLRIQRMREEHVGYGRWWITWIRIVRIE